MSTKVVADHARLVSVRYTMSHEPTKLDRELSEQELYLTEWLLKNGKESSEKYIEQLSLARVESLCGCGCASVDFSIEGKPSDNSSGMEILSDYIFTTKKGELNGIFVFAKNEQLAGLEVWSIDGQMTPDKLPEVDALKPFKPNEISGDT